MKKPKMLKYPKKPKASASVSVMENYLEKRKTIDKANAEKSKEYAKSLVLKKKISQL